MNALIYLTVENVQLECNCEFDYTPPILGCITGPYEISEEPQKESFDISGLATTDGEINLDNLIPPLNNHLIQLIKESIEESTYQ